MLFEIFFKKPDGSIEVEEPFEAKSLEEAQFILERELAADGLSDTDCFDVRPKS